MEAIKIPAHEYTGIMRYTDTQHEVKACPFCGETREIWATKYHHAAGDRFAVMCFGCCAVVDPGYAQDEWQALQHWNKRS